MAGKVCPVWVGYLLASPIRKLFENLIIDLLRKKYTNHDTKRKLFWTGKRFVSFINLSQ